MTPVTFNSDTIGNPITLLLIEFKYGRKWTKSISELSKLLSTYKVSIEETHHKNKVDSPSGTALKIAEVIAEARGINPEKIDIKSFREDGEIGVHKTIFKSNDDEIIIYHNAYNREIFALGALETSQWIARQKPGFYTYKDYMEDVSWQ